MISVIIPIYNSEKKLNRCVGSVVGQTYSDLEIILVDDGSVDGSLSICKEWERKDRRIHLISLPNRGVSSARNAGLRNASGTYVMFLDSDDYMKPKMCAVLLSQLEKKNADLVICGTEENGGNYWKPKKNADYLTLDAFKADFITLLHTELLSPPWNKLYKKEKITSEFSNGVSFSEDLIFNLAYIENCQRISFITDTPHFHEKENINSLTHNIDSHRLIDIEAMEAAILDFHGKRYDEQAYKKYVNAILQYTKQLLLETAKDYTEKTALLKNWRRDSYIASKPVSKVSVNWKNKLLLFFLQKSMWGLAYCICAVGKVVNR